MTAPTSLYEHQPNRKLTIFLSVHAARDGFQNFRILLGKPPDFLSKETEVAHVRKVSSKQQNRKSSKMTEEEECEHFASVTLARYGVGSDFPVSLDFHPQKGR